QRAATARRPVHSVDQGFLAGLARVDSGAVVHGAGHPGSDTTRLRSVPVRRCALFRDLLRSVAAVWRSRTPRGARASLGSRMTSPTTAASIDLDAPGKRIGHLELLWSDDEHAYGIIPVPIAVIANGNGPSALVTAGVHGDEYEGLLITRKLVA